MKKLSVKQAISVYSLEEDQKKAGTPIMGGILFIVIPVIVTLIFSDKSIFNMQLMIVILAYMGYGLIGFIDDYLIAVRHVNDGLSPKIKFLLQVILAVIFFIIYRDYAELSIHIPFTDINLHLGMLYAILVLLMFSGGSNAVNLTDGMDGLSSGCAIIAFSAFLVIALVQGMNDLALLIVSIIGGLFGYLYYNKKPARIFMGDTGSLALGGAMAAVAMVCKVELAYIVIAGIFVVDTMTVIIQVASVKIRHKRVFIYTPIHFAFRIKGMPETHVVYMFWLAEAVFAVVGLYIALH